MVPLLASLLLAACASTPPRSYEPEPLRPVTPPPSWRYQELSWEKLEGIEDWLDGEGAQAEPDLRIEARLQLADGWLTFTSRDLTEGNAPAASLEVRLVKARAVFQEVLAETEATPGQRARAQIGVQKSRALLKAPSSGGLTVIPRSRWRARSARPSSMTPLKGTWSRVTVHHSAETSSNRNVGGVDESIASLQRIQRYHMEDPGHRYGDIGYHFLIDSSGRIFEGRDLAWQGAHAGGSGGIHNNQNIGICVMGDYSSRAPSAAALTSLDLLIDELRVEYRIPASRVFAHSDFKVTACPGPALEDWVGRYH